MDLNMFEIRSKNCYKCDLETIIDSNGEYVWINLRGFGVETESKWLNIFNKHFDKSTLMYRREILSDIQVQAEKIFVRNDLFEQVIKCCKATNKEFLMLKKNSAYVFMKKIIIQKRLYKYKIILNYHQLKK